VKRLYARRMKTITSTEAGKSPGALFDRVHRGETILITRHGRPYVVCSPPPPEPEESPTD